MPWVVVRVVRSRRWAVSVTEVHGPFDDESAAEKFRWMREKGSDDIKGVYYFKRELPLVNLE